MDSEHILWQDHRHHGHIMVSHKGHQFTIMGGDLTQLGRVQGGSMPNVDTSWIVEEGEDEHGRGLDCIGGQRTSRFVAVVTRHKKMRVPQRLASLKRLD